MTLQERVNTVAALGFSDRQARFLVMVALHSGYCLRRQFETFAGIRYGKNVRAFLDGLVRRGFADRFDGRADRGHVYHLHTRVLYRAIGEAENRNRRPASAAQIARRLMLLDVAIGRRDAHWFTTERDKVDLFVSRYGIPASALPHRGTPAVGPEDAAASRYFVHKLPIFLHPDSMTPHFVYLAPGASADAFIAFLRDHASLLRALDTWTIVAVGVAPWPTLQAPFDRFAESLASTLPAAHDELHWYFERRRVVDRGDLSQVSVWDLRRYRDLHQRFDTPVHETLYAEWDRSGRIGTATHESRTGESKGTLLIEALPFAYQQFGSLPGVA